MCASKSYVSMLFNLVCAGYLVCRYILTLCSYLTLEQFYIYMFIITHNNIEIRQYGLLLWSLAVKLFY